MDAEGTARLVFLCSGGGGNLRFVHRAIEDGWFGKAILVAVITDRACAANAYARKHGIAEACIDFTEAGQPALLALLADARPDLVVTTVHRILATPVTDAYRGRLVNLHYSLLPAFAGAIGTRPVRDALAYGARLTGVTVHHVDATLDGGVPLVQAVIALRDGDTVDGVMDLVFRCGCLALAAGIARMLHAGAGASADAGREEALLLKQRTCLFSATVSTFPGIQSDVFWDRLRAVEHAEPH